jgi:hypothetical protein
MRKLVLLALVIFVASRLYPAEEHHYPECEHLAEGSIKSHCELDAAYVELGDSWWELKQSWRELWQN